MQHSHIGVFTTLKRNYWCLLGMLIVSALLAFGIQAVRHSVTETDVALLRNTGPAFYLQGCLACAANGEGDVFLLGTLTVWLFQTTRTLSTLQT